MQAKFILLPSDLSQTCLHIRWHEQSGHGSYRWQVFRFSVHRLSAPKRTCLRVCLVMESSLLRRYLKLWFNSCRIREFISVYRVGARNALNTEHCQNGCTSNRTQSPLYFQVFIVFFLFLRHIVKKHFEHQIDLLNVKLYSLKVRINHNTSSVFISIVLAISVEQKLHNFGLFQRIFADPILLDGRIARCHFHHRTTDGLLLGLFRHGDLLSRCKV